MSKKSLALGAAAMLCGALSLNTEVAATQSAQIDLKFNAANFTQESVTVGGKKIKFRAYKNIIYVANDKSHIKGKKVELAKNAEQIAI